MKDLLIRAQADDLARSFANMPTLSAILTSIRPPVIGAISTVPRMLYIWYLPEVALFFFLILENYSSCAPGGSLGYLGGAYVRYQNK